MSSFNFTKVERGKLGYGGAPIPEDVVRISQKSMNFGESVAKTLLATTYQTDSGDRHAKVSLAYDLYNQAILLQPADDGFTVKIAESGRGGGTLPMNFRKAGLPVGDYRLVEGERHVFQLAR